MSHRCRAWLARIGASSVAGLPVVEVQHVLIGVQPLPGDPLQHLHLTRVCADPMCSISRDPRRLECTIWTATAPLAVFTVRTYATATG